MADSYDALMERVRDIERLQSAAGLLDWDAETNMPPKGIEARSEELALLAGLVHDRMTDPAMGELLSQLEGPHDDPVVATNVREVRRDYERAVKAPKDLVKRMAEVATVAKQLWGEAREASAFDKFAPQLEELLSLRRQIADAVGYEGERYDEMLDEHEPGATAAGVETLFASLRAPLAELVAQLNAAVDKPDKSILRRQYPIERQKLWCRQSSEGIGFDFQAGRIDVSRHPFCSGSHPGDVRLTTRYDENYIPSALFGTLHESGHGLYEQGLPEAHRFTPCGRAVSLGVHESQSRLWENMVGRSRAYWERYYPQCQVAFPEALTDVSLDDFYRAVNTVESSLIRVEADEVTYCLHIILRFEIERELVAERLAVKDVPEAWNAKSDELLGVTPSNDAEGCLQDIHWAMGAFGYFPTYALGSLYAAQFYAAAERAIPDLQTSIQAGDTKPLLDWLRQNVHQHGMRYRAAELVERATGASLSIEPFMAYLRTKYLPIYGLA